ncbi:MAG: sigma-54-dependent Fis family transcriptional regulator [Nitrospira sp.]|nr:sigma-54-dependent Fis family transcriptional regulator [bacterium]MBL7047969.1 sigma-54-dependent Fis family transcriptional regulator [Nitrospira sp.]
MKNTKGLKGLSILIIDDRQALRSLEDIMLQADAAVYAGWDFKFAETTLGTVSINVILASIDLVDEKFIEIVRHYKQQHPEILFYVLTDQEYDSVETSQEAVRQVVDDYIKKPIDMERFTGIVVSNIGIHSSETTSLTVVDPLISRVKPYFLFRSPAMRRTLAQLPQISASDQTVLISGETGSGKEIVARAIHVLSGRPSGPFVPINCGAVPESLIESELFGHEKGAFTGAERTRKGKFESADKGTLFLDEIGDMPLSLQVRLLRALEEGSIQRIGSESPVPIDVRVIAATNSDLKKAVNDGLFREDLFYRLNVLRINLPPLRQRVEDIPLLSVHFLERAFAELGRDVPYPVLSSETIYLLEHYSWRGNVRELRNIMTRIATLLPRNSTKIFPFHVVPHLDDLSHSGVSELSDPLSDSRKEQGIFIPIGTRLCDAEDALINETLRHTDGNKTRAAAMLGVSLRNFRRKTNKDK